MNERAIPNPRGKNLPKSLHYRSSSVRATSNEKTGMTALSFSSETTTVLRYCAHFAAHVPEILLHDKSAVDLEPLTTVSSVLRNHDPNQIVGAPFSAKIDEETRRGTAVIRWSRTALGKETMADVDGGILRGVSFGYEVLKEEYIEAGETKDGFVGPAVLVTQWRALEISLTPIPADSTVGVGRSRDDDKADEEDEDDDADDEDRDKDEDDENEDDENEDGDGDKDDEDRDKDGDEDKDGEDEDGDDDEDGDGDDDEEEEIARACAQAVAKERQRWRLLSIAVRAGRITGIQEIDYGEAGTEICDIPELADCAAAFESRLN